MIGRPRIGVGIIVSREDKLLIIRRKHSHGKGTWAPPGGHLAFGETLENCAIRKISDETGILITNPTFQGITNDYFDDTGKHYFTFWMHGEYVRGEPVIGSAREISSAGWYGWNELPTPFFLTFQHMLHGVNSYGFERYAEIKRKNAKKYEAEYPNEVRDHDWRAEKGFELDLVPRVGVGVIVHRQEKILIIHRTNPHGAGTWAPPGGHIEHGESPEETAKREVMEETGLVIHDLRVIGATNDYFEESKKHYMTIWLDAKCDTGEPLIKSPLEIGEAKWMAWGDIPGPYFLTFNNFIHGNCYLFDDARRKYEKIFID